MSGNSQHTNRLAQATSPYLLQHKHNPVDWWQWGSDALAAAQQSHRPILLSVGYAACHWCHVMAHESFEDEATAKVMNELFVNIKVDREERPDIDQIYMSALHHLGEQGGWPLTMFLTPTGEPFWGGTYFPNTSRYGRPAFTDVLKEVARLFRDEPNKIEQNRSALLERLAQKARPAGKLTIGAKELDGYARQIGNMFDPVNGGLRGAPKFPQPAILEMLWRAGLRSSSSSSPGRREPASPDDPRLPDKQQDVDGRDKPGHDAGGLSALYAGDARFFETVEYSLERMCEGGIYDHLGGGFSRYSVDDKWLVPHFEKMLYDNAQLLELLALACARSGRALFRQRAQETVGWLGREMTMKDGAFASSLDADSEGEEGRFYVWSQAEIADVLGADDAAFFAQHYDVTAEGNFEGHTILNRLTPLPRSDGDEARLATLRAKLLAVRERRVRPGLDDKVLADWNGLMIAALVNAGVLLDEPQWIAMAQRAFDFIATNMTRDDSQHQRLGHSWRDGKLLYPGLASDFAAMIRAALALFEATGERRFLDRARIWQSALDQHYADAQTGGYYLTADDADGLVVRPHSTADDATPNHNAVIAQNLVRLAALAGNQRWRDKADRLFDGVLSAAADNLFGHVALLNALDLRIGGADIVLTGPDADRFAAVALKLPFLARIVLRIKAPGDLAASHPAQEKLRAVAEAKPTRPEQDMRSIPLPSAAFICVGETCSLPVSDPAAIAGTVAALRAPATEPL